MRFIECEQCGGRVPPESITCPSCGAASGNDEPASLRCDCGFLLCKLEVSAIEIKCRRCKRLVYIPFQGLPERYRQNISQKNRRKSRNPNQRRREGGENKGQYCATCEQHKPNVLYGKCLDCRTESIKIHYKSKSG